MVKTSTNSFIIRTPETFNYDISRNDAEKEVLHAVRGDYIYKAYRIGRKKVLIRHSGTPKDNIKVEVLKPSVQKEVLDELRIIFQREFDLGADLKAFYKMAAKDPILNSVVKSYKGLHLAGISGLFETLCWAIIGQQINLAFAHDVKRALVERFGDSISYEGEKFFLFPSPDQMLSISESDFKEMKFSRQKARYVKEVALAINEGLTLSSLEKLSYEEAMNTLTKIVGVGTWTANYTLLRCCARGDAFPVKDVALQKAIQIKLGLDAKPKSEALLPYQEKWAPYCHYATLYLWRSLSEV